MNPLQRDTGDPRDVELCGEAERAVSDFEQASAAMVRAIEEEAEAASVADDAALGEMLAMIDGLPIMVQAAPMLRTRLAQERRDQAATARNAAMYAALTCIRELQRYRQARATLAKATDAEVNDPDRSGGAS